MAHEIKVNVDVAIGEEAPIVVSCYFDALNPLPFEAYEPYLLDAANEGDGPADGPERVRRAAAGIARHARLFDGSCKRVVVEGQDVPRAEVDARVKTEAVMRVLEIWSTRVKERGPSSPET